MLMTRVNRNSGNSCRGLVGFFDNAVFAWAAALVMITATAAPGYDAQSDGSDGDLVPAPGTPTYVIDLSKAKYGHWHDTPGGDTNGDGKNDGVYDADHWAVVFKYNTINISQGTTVTFLNHPKGAPVVWLADGNVTINGTIILDGFPGGQANVRAPGGPGGFAGGIRSLGTPDASDGQGPGGGGRGNWPGSGGFGEEGQAENSTGGRKYGSPTLLPLIGGSGGGGHTGSGQCGGGGGGGAILIASSGTISIGPSGVVSANGGGTPCIRGYGSGGGIRLVADVVGGAQNGVGTLRAWSGNQDVSNGVGRIRIESLNHQQPTPLTIQGPASASQGPLGELFPPDTAPKLRIEKIEYDGKTLLPSSDPFGDFKWSEDVLISKVNVAATVTIKGNNVPPGLPVEVRLVREFGASETVTTGRLIAGQPTPDDPNPTTASVDLVIPEGRTIIQLRVVLP